MGAHLIDGEFQSDKYPWCRPDFMPLKFTDKSAWPFIWGYAEERRKIDPEFADDAQQRLRALGYPGPIVGAREVAVPPKSGNPGDWDGDCG